MKVRFQNFRCFKDTDLVELKKITLLVGENSTGKTSFLAGVNHIHGLLADEDIDLNTAPFELGSFQDICHRRDKDEGNASFSYEYEWSDGSLGWVFQNSTGDPIVTKLYARSKNGEDVTQLKLNFQENSASLEMILTDEEKKTLTDVGIAVQSKKPTKATKEVMSVISLNQFNRYNRRYLASKKGWHINSRWLHRMIQREIMDHLSYGQSELHSDQRDEELSLLRAPKVNKGNNALGKVMRRIRRLSPKLFDGSNRAIPIAPLRAEPKRVYSFGKQSDRDTDPTGERMPTRFLRYSRKNDRIWKNIQSILVDFGKEAGLFRDVKIESLSKSSTYPFSIMVTTLGGQTSNLMDVGYGVSQILPLVFEIISIGEGGMLFLIQQPEVHLHPRAQAAFATLIVKLAESGHEFVIETHSDFILDRLKYEIEQESIPPTDVGLLFFDREENEAKVYQINFKENGVPADLPPSYRKFFLEELDRVWP